MRITQKLKLTVESIVLGYFLSSCNVSSFHSVSREGSAKKNEYTTEDLDGVTKELPAIRTLQQSFSSSVEKKRDFPFSLDPQLQAVQTTFQLKDNDNPQSEVLDQLDAKKSIVDILVVIDNSNSMIEEQNNMATKMGALLTSLSNTDWRIAVITSNNSPFGTTCSLRGLIRSDVGSFNQQEAAFATAIQAGIGGSGNEQGILQAINGLKCPQQPWLRSDSSVAVLIVSDEDNCSNGTGCPGFTEQQLISFVEGSPSSGNLGRIVGENAGFYGIFSPPAGPCKTAFNLGIQYQRLVDYGAKKGAGAFGNICDSDYTATLSKISQNIALLLNDKFVLQKAPIAGSLDLKLQDKTGSIRKLALDVDYTLAGNTITFAKGKEPPLQSKLLAAYTFRVGAQLTYSLPLAQDAFDIKILDGNRELVYTQSGNQFSINPADFQLGKTLILQYSAPDSAERIFDLPENPIPGSENLNTSTGSCTLNNGISLQNGKLIANCAVTDKSDFVLSYKYVEILKTFTVSGVDDPEQGTWTVFVEGNPTTDYVRTGSSIELNFDPGLDAKIDIRHALE